VKEDLALTNFALADEDLNWKVVICMQNVVPIFLDSLHSTGSSSYSGTAATLRITLVSTWMDEDKQ